MKRNRMTKKVMGCLIPLAVFSIVSLSQGQANRAWTGAVDGNWTNAANWLGGTLPSVNDSGNLSTYWEIVNISSGMNPTSNIPMLNGGGTQPFLHVGEGMSIAYTLSEGYDGLNQVRPESMNGTDAVKIAANGSLTIHPDSSGFISMSRQQNTDEPGTYFVYRVGDGGVFDLAADRIDFAFSDRRLSHLILDGGTFQMTDATQFYGVRNFGAVFTNAHSKITLSNGANFAGTNVWFGNMDYNGDATLVFDITDEGSVVSFKYIGGSFTSFAAVEAARGKNFKSSTFGDDALVFTDHGDGLVSVTAVNPISFTPYELWLSGYTLGAFTNLTDDAENGGVGDGLDNLTEYALGSAPDVVDVPADVLPKSEVDGAMLNYIYQRQNPKDPNLSYIVVDGTDLVNGGLANTNTTETVSGVVVDGYETVTNSVSTATEGQQFMQLKMELGE